MSTGWAGWLEEHREEESGAERAVRRAREAEHRDDRRIERTEAERSAALAERRELLELAAVQSGVAARSLADVFTEAGRLGDEDAEYEAARSVMARIDKRREARQRDQLARAEQMTEVTALASRSAPLEEDLLAGAKQAHQQYVQATRAKMRDAAAGTPRRARRPFSAGGEARRSEVTCGGCKAEGIDASTSFLIHADPDRHPGLDAEIDFDPEPGGPVQRRVPMIYAGTEISR